MGRKQKNDGYEKVTDLVSIWRRGRAWYAYYTEGGKARRPSLGTKYVEQARKAATEIDEKIRKGLSLTSEDLDVEELFDRYMRRCKTEGVSHSTTRCYRLSFERFSAFCAERRVRKAGQVTVALLEDYRETRADEGASDSALFKESRDVKMVWAYGEDRRLIPVNHLKSLRVKKPPIADQRCYSEGEVEEIVANALPQDAGVFTVLAFTGMRRAELQWLRWSDVDIANGWIYVRAKEGWSTKSRKDRKFPIHPRVREVLERLPRKHQWVFTGGATKASQDRGGQIHTDHLRERLQELLERLGMERGDLHSFRRFFISHCANNGVPPTVVMKWVGHADLRMIVRYYSLRDDESRNAMEALAGDEVSERLCTLYAQSGVPQKQPRPQPPVFRVVTGAAS